MKVLVTILITLSLSFASFACSSVSKTNSELNFLDRDLNSETLNKFNELKLGDSVNRIQALFGRPSEKTSGVDVGERWVYKIGQDSPITEVVFFIGAEKEGLIDSKILIPNYEPSGPLISKSSPALERIDSPRCGRHYDLSDSYLVDPAHDMIVNIDRYTGEVKSITYQIPRLLAQGIEAIKNCPKQK
ncbi:MAG: hypothetical protein AAB250_10355 [Bdellovibrionota bacterium]